MKTPREILFERHRHANAKLDAVRRHAAAALAPRPRLLDVLREWIAPKPQAWAALAAIWVLICALKLSTGGEPRGATIPARATPPGVTAELQQQKLFFAELVDALERRDAPPAQPRPRPRSERSLPFLTA